MSATVTTFGDLPKAVEEGNERAILELLIDVTSEAKALAEVDTGQLRNSIMYQTSSRDGGFNQGGKTPAPTKLSENPKRGEGVVGSALLHAIYNEFGTRNMAAEPFLRPAVMVKTSGGRAKDYVVKYQEESVAAGMRKGPRKVKKV